MIIFFLSVTLVKSFLRQFHNGALSLTRLLRLLQSFLSFFAVSLRL
ncbi:hypothetical protein [Bartonella sp. CL45QHWL]